MTTQEVENEPILTPIELRDLLALRGITTNLTDTQLCTLIQYKINELTGMIGVDILPTPHCDINNHFKDDTIRLLHYPTTSITELTIDNKVITDYTLDNENGILYLNNPYFGKMKVDYIASLPQNIITTVFTPLLIDFIEYGLPETKAKQGATSVKEGDMQINYSTNSTETLGGKIQKRINILQNYNTRIRVL